MALKMMKHVQLSPYRSRADTVSLSSTTSYGSLSPEPLCSRSSSYSSLNEPSVTTTIKVYARCLRPDIEYKTLSITFQSTCKEIVGTLLGKYKMKHRDPKLFYLSMEVTVRKAGIKTILTLDDKARPAVLQSCHPKGDSKFSLQTRRGGLVKVHDSVLNSNSQYKSLLVSARTTCDELIALLLNCYNNKEKVEQFSLYEVNPAKEQQRKLHPDDLPLQVQQAWIPDHKCHFLIRRNPNYLPLSRRKMFWVSDLPPLPISSQFKPEHRRFSESTTSLTLIKRPSTEETLHTKENSTKLRETLPSYQSVENNSGIKTSQSRNSNGQMVQKNKSELHSAAQKNNSNKTDLPLVHTKQGRLTYADYENYFYI